MRSLTDLMEDLRGYTMQYALENGVEIQSNNFVKCLNPEHDDHNPSMHFWEENNVFHCFSCGATYDIFNLAHVLENKPIIGPDFIEDNVFYLAQRYGLAYEHLRKELTPEEIQKYVFFQTMKCFAQYVVSHRNKEYLEARKIKDETAIKLQIGSVDSYEECLNHLLQQGCKKEIIDQIGITKFKVNENKMIFIIKDEYGRPASFVSREMKGTPNMPKYINGDSTCIFNKSRIFYLWSDIKKEYNPLSNCVIVEGYMDAVTAYQTGYRQFVALGSASFTDEHIKIIERSPKLESVVVALDNDATGKKRMSSLLERLKSQRTVKNYRFAIYKEGVKDIDELLNEHGKMIDLNQIFELKTLFDYELMSIKQELGNSVDETALFDRFVTIISKTERPKEREEQSRILAKYLTKYSYHTILDEVKYVLSGEEVAYKKTVEATIGRAMNELKMSTENALPILSDLKDEIEDINKKFKKKTTSVFDKALEDFDSFENDKKNYNLFNIKFNIPWFDDLNIAPGETVTISALPNVGKSTLFQKILKNTILLNTNACIIYVTPDDPAEKVYSNLIASFSGLSREYCKNPYYDKYYGLESGNSKAQELFDIYCSYKNKIREFIATKRLIILDVKNGIGEFRTLEQKLKAIDEDKTLKDKFKIMICDPVNKIDYVGASNKFEALAELSAKLKKICENYKILTFLNYELNKVKNNARLSQYNISGTNKPVYDANVLGFMYNPTRNLQEFIGTEYETKMFWTTTVNGQVIKNPILVTLQEKTKSGNDDKNGVPYFYKLDKNTSDLFPIENNTQEYYYYENIWRDEWNNLYKSPYNQ